MSRRIVLRGRFASQSLRLRPLSLGHFSKETIKAAKHSVGPARENPCPTLAGAVFSQTLYMEGPHSDSLGPSLPPRTNQHPNRIQPHQAAQVSTPPTHPPEPPPKPIDP